MPPRRAAHALPIVRCSLCLPYAWCSYRSLTPAAGPWRLIANVLQKPFGWNLPPHLLLLGHFVNPSSHGGELQTLIAHIAVEGDLLRRSPSRTFSRHQISKVGLIAAAAAIVEFRRVAA